MDDDGIWKGSTRKDRSTKTRNSTGKKDFEMIETLVERAPPDRLRLVYEAKGVWNEVDNRFSEIDAEATLWQVHTEFRCRGVMWLVSLVMPGMFKTQTETYMRSFRNFAEGGPLG